MSLWFLAVLGATVTFLADVLCVQAARDGRLWLVALSCILFAAGAPIWFYMSRISGGSLVIPAIYWNVVASILAFSSVLIMERHQTPRQWIGLVIMFFGIWVRG